MFTGGDEALCAWWSEATNKGGGWFDNHPVIKNTPDPAMRIPFGMHGDDAGVAGNEQILVSIWNSVAVSRATIDNRLLFTMVKVRDILKPVTLHQIYKVWVWSLNALGGGCFPDSGSR